MLKRILLVVRIAFPFVMNVILFPIIFNLQSGTENQITNTFFHQSVINIFIGVLLLYLSSSSSDSYPTRKASLFSAEQNVRDFHRNGRTNTSKSILKVSYIKLLYIIIGILFLIASGITTILN